VCAKCKCGRGQICIMGCRTGGRLPGRDAKTKYGFKKKQPRSMHSLIINFTEKQASGAGDCSAARGIFKKEGMTSRKIKEEDFYMRWEAGKT
jgi:hypothetical protein